MSAPAAQNSGQAPPWREAVARTRQRTRAFVWFLLKTILPLYLATEVLKQSGVLAWLAGFLAPLMGIWGLPGEAAAVLTAGILVNMYAATAVAAPLGLTWQQVSVLGLILGIAHSLVVEAAVVRQLTPHYHRLTLLRLALGFGSGWVLKLILM